MADDIDEINDGGIAVPLGEQMRRAAEQLRADVLVGETIVTGAIPLDGRSITTSPAGLTYQGMTEVIRMGPGVSWRTGVMKSTKKREVSKVAKLEKEATQLLTTKEGRIEFEKVFGKRVIEEKYVVPDEARERIKAWGLGTGIRTLIENGMYPHKLLKYIEENEHPELLTTLLRSMRSEDSSRRRALMIGRTPSTTVGQVVRVELRRTGTQQTDKYRHRKTV